MKITQEVFIVHVNDGSKLNIVLGRAQLFVPEFISNRLSPEP